MGWADFGQALYLNFSAAAGQLADTKLALRQEEREERKLALQEEAQKAQVAYNKAQLVLKEFIETREQKRHEDAMDYKQQMLDWQKGSVARENDKRKLEAKQELETYIAKAEADATQKEEERVATEEREKAETDEAVKRLVATGIPEEQARVIVDTSVPEATRSVIAKDARIRIGLQRRFPDATPEEIDAMWNDIINPPAANRTAVAQYLQEIEEIDASDLDDTEKARLRDAAMERALQKGVSQSATNETDRQKKIREAEARWGKGSAEAQAVIDEVYGVGEDEPPDLTENERKKREDMKLRNKYATGTPNRTMMDSMGQFIGTNDKYERARNIMDQYLEGSTGPADIDPELLDDVAHQIGLMVDLYKPTSERIDGLEYAQTETLANLPMLWKALKDIDPKDLNRWNEIIEKGARLAGTTSEKALVRFNTLVELTSNLWLRIESGAVINDEEIRKIRRLLPQIGTSKEVNVEIVRSLAMALDNFVSRDYEKMVGKEWADAATNINLAESKKVLSEIGTQYPTALDDISDIVDGTIE